MEELQIEDQVLVGGNGELYLAYGSHRPLDYVTGVLKPSQKLVQRFRANIAGRAAMAREAGAQYLHLVSPDKHSVLRENFPVKDFQSVAEIFGVGQMADVLYPAELLTTLSAMQRVYHLTDTHWTIEAAIAVAREVGRRFGVDDKIIDTGMAVLTDWLQEVPQDISGDLGRKLASKPTHRLNRLRKSPFTVHSNKIAGNNGKMFALVNNSKLFRPQGRLLAFCDSFLFDFPEPFAMCFKQTLMCRTPFIHPEILRGFRPTHVLTQCVERYLVSTLDDRTAIPFLMMPKVFGDTDRYTPTAARFFARALSGYDSKMYVGRDGNYNIPE